MEKIITFGEIMLRLTPPDYSKIDQTRMFQANYGGGEANVAVSLAHLGHKCYFISKLPPNDLGDSAIKHLRGHNVNTDYVVRGSTTLGIYFYEQGFGGRPSKVIYNRKHSAITRIEENEVDYDEVFNGATLFHLSGISLALGDKVRKVVFKCLEACKKYNVKVSFDFNYRAKLWEIEEARPIFKKILPYVDILFASYFDANSICQIKPDKGVDEDKENENVMRKMLKKYDIECVFSTFRTIYSATENALRATCITKDESYSTDNIRFQIYDRIGAGDAFASGVLHGLLKNGLNQNDYKYALNFGLVTAVLKHTIYGDVCVLKEEDINAYMLTSGRKGVER